MSSMIKNTQEKASSKVQAVFSFCVRLKLRITRSLH